MRFRSNYQTVVPADMASNATLQPTPGQIGVIDTFPGTDSNVQSDYSYMPGTIQDNAFDGRPYMTTRRPGRTGRTPWVYVLPGAESSVDKGSQSQEIVEYAGAGRNTGSPDHEVRRIETHGPFNHATADNAIPTGSKQPSNLKWWQKFLGVKDQTDTYDERIMLTTGAANYEDGYLPTPASLGANTFIVPDVRNIFDTPSLEGVGTKPDGSPYVAKAGRPTQDPWFDPQEVTINNTRWTEVNGSAPFLPDRVRAGTADPLQARPAQIPQWLSGRKFDQWASQHLNGMKGVIRNPLIGQATATFDESASVATGHMGQMGYHYSTPAPGMTPSGPQPNTVRNVPVAWDVDLNVIDTGAGANASRTRSLRRG
jgi:hypothetical protein